MLLALKLRMIDLGALLVDGTVLPANASKKRSRRLKSLKKLEQEELEDRKTRAVEGLVQRMIEEAETVDAQEDRLYVQEGYPDEIFAAEEASGADRLERIRKAIRQVEASERNREGRLQSGVPSYSPGLVQASQVGGDRSARNGSRDG